MQAKLELLWFFAVFQELEKLERNKKIYTKNEMQSSLNNIEKVLTIKLKEHFSNEKMQDDLAKLEIIFVAGRDEVSRNELRIHLLELDALDIFPKKKTATTPEQNNLILNLKNECRSMVAQRELLLLDIIPLVSEGHKMFELCEVIEKNIRTYIEHNIKNTEKALYYKKNEK